MLNHIEGLYNIPECYQADLFSNTFSFDGCGQSSLNAYSAITFFRSEIDVTAEVLGTALRLLIVKILVDTMIL